MDKKELIAQIKALQAQLKEVGASREEIKKAKKEGTPAFQLVLKDAAGKKIRAFEPTDFQSVSRLRRDWYRVIVLDLKQKISMHIEYRKQA